MISIPLFVLAASWYSCNYYSDENPCSNQKIRLLGENPIFDVYANRSEQKFLYTSKDGKTDTMTFQLKMDTLFQNDEDIGLSCAICDELLEHILISMEENRGRLSIKMHFLPCMYYWLEVDDRSYVCYDSDCKTEFARNGATIKMDDAMGLWHYAVDSTYTLSALP